MEKPGVNKVSLSYFILYLTTIWEKLNKRLLDYAPSSHKFRTNARGANLRISVNGFQTKYEWNLRPATSLVKPSRRDGDTQ